MIYYELSSLEIGSNIMITTALTALITTTLVSLTSPIQTTPEDILLAEKSLNLENRQQDRFVNEVFKENILLTAKRMSDKDYPQNVNWDELKKPSQYSFTLNPNEAFAYHETALPEFEKNVVKTTNSHFSGDQGFKSDGYLMGDGVCHFASIIYWAALDADLEAKSPVNHDFAVINDVPREYGVAIYFDPASKSTSQLQNLYIKNNRLKPIEFKFDYDGKNLKVKIYEKSS